MLKSMHNSSMKKNRKPEDFEKLIKNLFWTLLILVVSWLYKLIVSAMLGV